MQVCLPLDKMTTLEKLCMIEDIWDNLCHDKADVPSPAWHADVLRLREQQICNGDAKFLDLDEAKRILRDRLA